MLSTAVNCKPERHLTGIRTAQQHRQYCLLVRIKIFSSFRRHFSARTENTITMTHSDRFITAHPCEMKLALTDIKKTKCLKRFC